MFVCQVSVCLRSDFGDSDVFTIQAQHVLVGDDIQMEDLLYPAATDQLLQVSR
jgi:hypothetical protein